MKLEIVIPITPFPKQSVRASNMNGKLSFHKDRKITSKENIVKLFAKKSLPKDFKLLDGKIYVYRIIYVFPYLKSFSKSKISKGVILKTTTPDLTDNLNKGLFDALHGVVYENDSKICYIGNIVKLYGVSPKIILSIGDEYPKQLEETIKEYEQWIKEQ